MLQNLPSHLAVKVALHALPMLVSFCKMGPSWSKTVLGSFSGIFIWQVQELHASLATSQSFGSDDDDDDDDDDDETTTTTMMITMTMISIFIIDRSLCIISIICWAPETWNDLQRLLHLRLLKQPGPRSMARPWRIGCLEASRDPTVFSLRFFSGHLLCSRFVGMILYFC